MLRRLDKGMSIADIADAEEVDIEVRGGAMEETEMVTTVVVDTEVATGVEEEAMLLSVQLFSGRLYGYWKLQNLYQHIYNIMLVW